MMVRSASLLVLLIVLTANTSAQLLLTNWRTISSMRTVRAVSLDANNKIWCATSGGVFTYNIDTEEIQEFRNINALQSLDISTILCDTHSNKVFAASNDGALDILDINVSSNWENISDIKRASQYPRRGVRSLFMHNNRLYISTDFGIVVFNPDRNLFIETVDRIGPLEERTRVNETVIFNDTIWCATDQGIAVAPIQSLTLRLPSVWKMLDTAMGIPKGSISHIQTDGKGVYFSSGNTVYYYKPGYTANVVSTQGAPIISMVFANDTISFATKDGSFIGTSSIPSKYVLLDGHSYLQTASGPLAIAFVKGVGLSFYRDTLYTIPLNSPNSNQFAQVVTDQQGGLWVATDIVPGKSGTGLSYYDGQQWTAITETSLPALPTNNCYRVSALSDGSILAGLWGKGAARVTPGKNTLTLYNQNNTQLAGITEDPNYVLVGEGVLDRSGALWMVNEQATNRVLIRVDDNSSEYFVNCGNISDNIFRSLCIDNLGTKWVGGYIGGGLLGINDRNTPNNPSDDVCNIVRSSNTQLPDNVVTVLRTDLSGAVWIGTGKGVAVMSTPGSLSNTTVPFVRRISALQQVVINDIFVDAINNKWIATPVGVFVLNVDGTEVLATITTANSQLLENNVRSITINPTTGEAFFGTANGCSVARTQSIKPLAEVTLSFAPQPFKPNEHGQVIIDGLSADADVKIMTTGGVLVAAFQAKGRQIVWDGTDVHGKTVSPGVYIVHAVSTTSPTNGVGKLLITR